MGMTDRQFASFRREQLQEFEEMLELARTTDNEKLIKDLEKAVEKAKADVEL